MAQPSEGGTPPAGVGAEAKASSPTPGPAAAAVPAPVDTTLTVGGAGQLEAISSPAARDNGSGDGQADTKDVDLMWEDTDRVPHKTSSARIQRPLAAIQPRPKSHAVRRGDEEQKVMDFRAPVHVRRRSQLDTERNMLEGLRAEMKASGGFSDELATTSTRVARELPMRFCYTIILRNPEVPKNLMPTLRSLQEKVVMSLLRLNLEVKILATTELTERKLVILVSAESENDELLHRESYRLDCERYLKFGTGAVPQSEFDAAVKQPLSPAMKLYLTWLMVERALKFVHLKDFEVREKALADSVVAAHVSSVPSWKRSLGLQTCGLKQFRTIATRFALHDLVFNEKFMHDIVRRPYSKVLDLSDATKQLYDQFGARVAIYFTFVSSYTQMLAPLALFSVLFYLIVRIADWHWYVRLLGVLGICVPAIWAPIVLNRWEAKSKQLAFDWKLENLPDKAVPNDRDPESEMKYDEELDFHWVQYDPKNHRKKVTSCLIPFAIINLLILIIAMTPFVQWYVFGKLSPTCDCCNWFLDNPMESRAANVTVPAECVVFDRDPAGVGYKEIETCSYFVTCFSSLGSTVGTDRWVYILIQGILLGIALDVVQFELFVAFTVFLTDKESWASENEYERNLIRKQFLFLWVNMYFWFLFIAFVYVPFGDVVQDILQELGFEAFVPGSGWRNGVINLDEAFVTPLVVTQALNLTLETFIPYLAAKAELKASKAKRAAQKKLSLQILSSKLSHVEKKKKKDQESSGRSRSGSIGRVASGLLGRLTHSPKPSTPMQQHEVAVEMTEVNTVAPMEEQPHFTHSPAPTLAPITESAPSPMPAHRQESPLVPKRVLHGMGSAKSVRRQNIERQLGRMGIRDSGIETPALEAMDETVRHTPASLVSRMVGLWKHHGNREDPPISHSATSEDSNHYTGSDVILQAKKEDFHPRGDYLDMLMQFGYVCMFTAAWALCPVTAFVNNIFEIRGDAFKMMYGLRRPVPSMDRDIGEWLPNLKRSASWAIPVVALMAVISTGQAELWSFSACNIIDDKQDRMGPDLGCFSTWGIRAMVAFLIEHLAMAVQFLMFKQDFTSTQLKLRKFKAEAEQQTALQDRLLPPLPEQFEKDLKLVFNTFDADGNNNLGRSEAAFMFWKLHKEATPPRQLTEEQLTQLFTLLDEDNSMTISFAECAMAVKLAENDPLMQSLFGLNLEECAAHLAAQFRDGVDPYATLRGPDGRVPDEAIDNLITGHAKQE